MIRSFKAFRPAAGQAEQVSARSSGSEGPEQIAAFLKNNPQSYLNVVKPHLMMGEPERDPARHYPVALDYLEKLIREGYLKHDDTSSVYLYKQTKLTNNQSFTGLICLVSVDDYLNGRIKKHENTRTQKEVELARHVEEVKSIGEPVLLTHESLPGLEEIYNKLLSAPPEYDFVSENTLRHQLWVVSDPAAISALKEQFNRLDAFYIADGHHRSAGAGRFGLNCREKNPAYTGEEDFNYFLACLIPAEELNIVAFHRLVKDLNGIPAGELLERLSEDFTVTPSSQSVFSPHAPHHFGLYLQGKWYELALKAGRLREGDVLFNLDVSLIETYALKKHLGIADSKTDPRIAFLEGSKGEKALTDAVDDGSFEAAFTLYPTAIREVIEVADKGLVMPPKSTWIEPKLRTGLIVQKF